MHIRTLNKVGVDNLHFYTSGIGSDELAQLSVHPHAVPEERLAQAIQAQIDLAVADNKVIAIFPEGPYCSPTLAISI
jgi:hypothetical protein